MYVKDLGSAEIMTSRPAFAGKRPARQWSSREPFRMQID
jgi:hypothetical protein